MIRLIEQFVCDDRGATSLEYGLLALFSAISASTAVMRIEKAFGSP